MRVAIVHDWLVGGGGERVVQELHRRYPDAPIYTSYCSDEWRTKLDGKVVTGYLQRWPFSRLRKLLPLLRIWWFSHLDLSGFDLVISSTGNGEAKGVRLPEGTKHVCYCFSPVHFYWQHYDQYLENPGFGVFNPIARLGLKLLVKPLRAWDLKASQRPDAFVAISTHIQEQIKTYYGRDSVVIHPPVDVERFKVKQTASRKGFVTMGRLVPQKKVDVLIRACNELSLQLNVIGRGPDLARLKKLAGPTIEFFTDVSDDEMPAYLADAEAFLFASYEDFGIAPVEAMAAGTPVIAYKAGGALDYVVEGKTGQFFGEQTPKSLIETLRSFDVKKFDHNAIVKSAESFSVKHFHSMVEAFVKKEVSE